MEHPPRGSSKRTVSGLFGIDPTNKALSNLVIPSRSGSSSPVDDAVVNPTKGVSPLSEGRGRSPINRLSKPPKIDVARPISMIKRGMSPAAHSRDMPPPPPPQQHHHHHTNSTSSVVHAPGVASSTNAPADRTISLADLRTNSSLDSPLPLPPSIGGRGPGHSRSSSAAGSSRPGSRSSSHPPTPVMGSAAFGESISRGTSPAPGMGKMRKRNIFGPSNNSHSRAGSLDNQAGPFAWVYGHESKQPYSIQPLTAAEPIPELWDEHGNTFVHLFPKSSGKGPSFRVDSTIFSASPVLAGLALGDSKVGELGRQFRQTSLELSPNDAYFASRNSVRSAASGTSSETRNTRGSDMSSSDDMPSEIHVYLPLNLSSDPNLPPQAQGFSNDDLDVLVNVRNTFAFLIGQSLVATQRRHNAFAIFMKISEVLTMYDFTNLDRSTFGEVANHSFDNYVEELKLGDVRGSRDKTIEAIILSERMRSVKLYNEAFVHAVGKFDDLKKLDSPKWDLISAVSRTRMERAALDLQIRVGTIRRRLEDFDFTAMFVGIMNSKTADERKLVRFDQWKSSFFDMRKHILNYYKTRYGSWPPKASSKKNTLETSGLNRIVLKELYADFSSLYDLLVDRTNLTNRATDIASFHAEDDEDPDEAVVRALRRVLAEYDSSTPPVQPPVPFDVPILPVMLSQHQTQGMDAKKAAKIRAKKLKDEEVTRLLRDTRNADSYPTHTERGQGKHRQSISSNPFLSEFLSFEFKSARGVNELELQGMRVGYWLFMYAVLQALPMLVIDAPALKWTRGVEYFLCVPPRSSVPWAREASGPIKTWYGVAGGGGVVSLPSDVVEHGVEGVYRRSHCWEVAKTWAKEQGRSSVAMAAAGVAPDEPATSEKHASLSVPGGMRSMTPESSHRGRGNLTPHRNASPAPRSSSRSQSRHRRNSSSLGVGLEAIPLPAGVVPEMPAGASHHTHNYSRRTGGVGGPVPTVQSNPGMTFDSIMSSMDNRPAAPNGHEQGGHGHGKKKLLGFGRGG